MIINELMCNQFIYFPGKGGVASTGIGGRATSAQFKGCYGVWQDTAGNLYVSENTGASVKFISASTTIVTAFAGKTACFI